MNQNLKPSTETNAHFLKIGSELDKQLDSAAIMGFNEIARHLGMSRQLVYYHNAVALGKLAHRLRKALGE